MASSTDQVAVPAGFKLVPDKPRLNTGIIFRPTADELTMLDALRASLPSGTWSETMRWLVNTDEVRDLIARRLQAVSNGHALE